MSCHHGMRWSRPCPEICRADCLNALWQGSSPSVARSSVANLLPRMKPMDGIVLIMDPVAEREERNDDGSLCSFRRHDCGAPSGCRHTAAISKSLATYSPATYGTSSASTSLSSSDESALAAFASKLYLNDLYLACGCAYNSEGAWTAFDARYRRFITNLVRFCHRHGTDTEEIADLSWSACTFRTVPVASGSPRMMAEVRWQHGCG